MEKIGEEIFLEVPIEEMFYCSSLFAHSLLSIPSNEKMTGMMAGSI
jgi:hypothetical protein